jgi:hypothetical protein
VLERQVAEVATHDAEERAGDQEEEHRRGAAQPWRTGLVARAAGEGRIQQQPGVDGAGEQAGLLAEALQVLGPAGGVAESVQGAADDHQSPEADPGQYSGRHSPRRHRWHARCIVPGERPAARQEDRLRQLHVFPTMSNRVGDPHRQPSIVSSGSNDGLGAAPVARDLGAGGLLSLPGEHLTPEGAVLGCFPGGFRPRRFTALAVGRSPDSGRHPVLDN